MRPYFNTGIVDLEKTVGMHQADRATLLQVAEELRHRKTDRAIDLLARVRKILEAEIEPPGSKFLARGGKPAARTATREARVVEPFDPSAIDEPSETERPALQRAKAPRTPVTWPPITNDPLDILSAWTVLEVLSPVTFTRPAQLAGGDMRAVAKLGSALPWEGAGEKARPGTRLMYQIVLGTIDMAKAIDRLGGVFVDRRAERPQARGEAIIASVIVDRLGRPIEEDAISLSSFAWGTPLAMSGGDLSALAAWTDAEAGLVGELDKQIRRRDASDESQPLTRKDIDGAFKWLVRRLGLPADLVRPPAFAIRIFPYFKSPESPEALLLNSFYLRDLGKVAGLIRAGKAPSNLLRYLGVQRPGARQDLLNDAPALARAVEPLRFPAARWPSPGGHSLVLLQQAAVNLAADELREGGLLAVNGPPGTGKTTLLRDQVSALVAERALAMTAFLDPGEAFVHSGQKVKAGNSWIHLYELDESLRGFEMLIASSNNKAVENVSAELPLASAVADDQPALRHFKALSDRLTDAETWGLGAAVLGNGANRGRFRQTFWWDKEVGLSTYLAAATGVPQVVQDVEVVGGERPPRIVTEEDAPDGPVEALQRWRAIRQIFIDQHKALAADMAEIEGVRTVCLYLPDLLRALQGWRVLMDGRPGFWSRLFGTRRWRAWLMSADGARAEVEARLGAAESAGVIQRRSVQDVQFALARAKPPAPVWFDAVRRLAEALTYAETRRVEIGEQFIDASFFTRSHADRHRATPWMDAAIQKKRDDLFVQAIAVHKAFIDAAAKPLRHNLGAAMNILGGGSLGSPEKDRLIPHLWSSLFLVTPAVSTTFASVDRMLGRLPPESLGWLLIDEAGQATPQAAVGALMRTRRAIVVGDPLQIPPVVMLPDTLTDAIHRHFGADPDVYNAPAASVQTLADAATAYVAEFQGRTGSRTVGVPLLVHRRCADPMFSVSNVVAYERQMVQAKSPRPSAIMEVLGSSHWIDVEGRASDKWSAQEGEVVLKLLRRLAESRTAPDLYIVTPFVVVQDNLRRLIVDSRVLDGVVESPSHWVRDRVGTVHTVQGREAEAVIFVLGAPLATQSGARGWAGGQPNLLNVAVTRAKEVIYVVGSRARWKGVGVFAELDRRLPEGRLLGRP